MKVIHRLRFLVPTWFLPVTILLCGLVADFPPCFAQLGGQRPVTVSGVSDFQGQAAELLRQLRAMEVHPVGVSDATAMADVRERENYLTLVREKVRTNWFAALLSLAPTNSLAIERRFATWQSFLDFVSDRQALVETWTIGEGGLNSARRLSGAEVALLRKQPRDQPVFVRLIYRDSNAGFVVTQQVEFGFNAPAVAAAAQQAYRKHRDFQSVASEILGARNDFSRLSADAQERALKDAVASGRFPLAEMPTPSNQTNDLLVAIEYEVDEQGLFKQPLYIWRESQVRRAVSRVGKEQYRQTLLLKRANQKESRETRGFIRDVVTGDLVEVLAPVPGRHFVELRIKNSAQPDPRGWNAMEFGEPALLHDASLANFSLLSAHFDKKRKELALRKNRLDMFAEPVFAGLNIGGGAAGVLFPLGAAARLGYNATVTPALLPKLPSAKQMRELFVLLAARERLPEIRVKASTFLSKDDINKLEKAAAKLTDGEVSDFLQRISDEDLKAMLRIAKMKNCDDKVTLLLSLIADAGKVSGWTDEPGVPRDLFNSIYFSVTGEISIDNCLLVLAGARDATPYAGTSLKTLLDGNGPTEAWFQYFDLTVDFRAIVNTVARLRHRDLADKELKKPFPYSPRLTDISAYEIRLFGMPLLIWHKRGLMKADYQAFTSDYAYGMIGERIVERFGSKEEMDAEIEAGRMMPLGYVRVLDGGRWKESNLAVFAHRVERGKYAGKITVIIYGLKAYQEQSQLMRREVERFKQFEKARLQGGVIEQVVDAENRTRLTASTFEPKIYVGTNAAGEVFTPLLSALLEAHRLTRLQAWGVALSSEDMAVLSAIRRELLSRDIFVHEADSPLLGVDRFFSSFIYRKVVGGYWQTVKLVNIPSMTEITRELAKAQEGARIEHLHQTAISNDGDGIVFVNAAHRVADRFEVGPLWQGVNGDVLGYGVRVGSQAVDQVLTAIDKLPVTDQARVRLNHFASALVDLDADGDGRLEKAFVTIEFPPDKAVQRHRTNLFSGESELLTFTNGGLLSSVTDRRITELVSDERDVERATRVFVNVGTREQPVKGLMLEETRTLEAWLRDWRRIPLDPGLPVLRRLRVNYLTGEIARETFGLYPLPLETVDPLLITTNRYNPYGVFSAATVRDNGRTEQEFARPLLARLLQPAPGVERFVLTSKINAQELANLRNLGSLGFKTTVERLDLVRGLTNTLVFDNTHGGRRVSETHSDRIGNLTVTAETTAEFSDSFLAGLLPIKTVTKSGALLGETYTSHYDTVTRRLTAAVQDFTGGWRTNVWDYRWENPVEVRTALRTTTNQFNRTETSTSSITTTRDGNEELSRSIGFYEPLSKAWRIQRTLWFRPDITNRVDSEMRTAYGRLVAVQTGGLSESRVNYNSDGVETSRETWRRELPSAPFRLYRVENNYRWENGQRDAQVEVYVPNGGQSHLYDSYAIVSDSEGRILIDGIRNLRAGFPLETDLNLRCVVSHDGASDRILKSDLLQNGQLRESYLPQPHVLAINGTNWLLVEVRPYWGLSFTNAFRLGEPLERPAITVFENRDRREVTAWIPGTAIATDSLRIGRDGQLRERVTRQLSTGTNAGLAFDTLLRFKIGPWDTNGTATALAEQRASLRGTDVSLFKDTTEERLYFDVSKPYDSPHFALDRFGLSGLRVEINGGVVSNVIAVHTTTLLSPSADGHRTNRMLKLTSVDLYGLLFHKWSHQLFTRGGHITEEHLGRIPGLGAQRYTPERLLFAAGLAPTNRIGYYFYESKISADLLTRIDFWQTAADYATDGNRTRYHFRRIEQPQELKWNPYLPTASSVWKSWLVHELKPNGDILYSSKVIYDAEGVPRTSVIRKHSSGGAPSEKVVYHVSSPKVGDLKNYILEKGSNVVPLKEGFTNLDLLKTPSLYFFIDSSGVAVDLKITDQEGRSTVIASTPTDSSPTTLSFWPVRGGGDPVWLPDEVSPQHGTVLTAPAYWTRRDGVRVIPLSGLHPNTLNLMHPLQFSITARAESNTVIRVSPIYALSGVGTLPRIPPKYANAPIAHIPHSTGLETFVRFNPNRTEKDIRGNLGWDSNAKWGIQPVVTLQPQDRGTFFPVVTLVDYSESDAPRALYALAADTGDFLESYRVFRWGDIRVVTLVSGFAVPELKVYRGGVLEDENAESEKVYPLGGDFNVHVPIARQNVLSKLWFSKTYANWHHRLCANIFKYFGDYVLSFLPLDNQTPAEFRDMCRRFQRASVQAEEISQLPTLAEAVLPLRDVPWMQTMPEAAQLIETEGVKRRLKELAAKYPATGLLPTAPGTEVEAFVETSHEAALIELLIQVNETALATKVLAFYRQKTREGVELVLGSYDARTGARHAPARPPRRPANALPSSDAQLALAKAAFNLGSVTLDADVLAFATNVTARLLRDYRASQPTDGAPRGISVHPHQGRQHWFNTNITLWPLPERYALRVNADAYPFLKRLNDFTKRIPVDHGWSNLVQEATLEQEAWLTRYIVPQVKIKGVVPKGVFQLQDIHRDSTVYCVDRWTLADDWLAWLEAADAMGQPKQDTRQWLENLARVHGVTINGIWGLDWTIPLRRSDAISPMLTARFARVAELLGHSAAAAFARQNLSMMAQAGRWPSVITEAAPDPVLQTGQGSLLYPATNHFAVVGAANNSQVTWPDAIGVNRELLALVATNAVAPASVHVKRRVSQDVDLAIILAAGWFLLLLCVSSAWWWWVWSYRKRASKQAQSSPLVRTSVMELAERRWAKNVLGSQPPNAGDTRYSNAPVEQNFLMQLRAIYKLVLEWRRRENRWAEDDPRLVDHDADNWLNGLDEYVAVLGIYMRFVIKAGTKDGVSNENVLVENEDSNHIWSRLVIFHSEYHRELLTLLNNYTGPENADFCRQMSQLLNSLGVRQREDPFDARQLYNFPHNRDAMDLLIIKRGVTLEEVMRNASEHLKIPYSHIVQIIESYKKFKRREDPTPIHPYTLELAKLLPQFLLAGLLGLAWYNAGIGEEPISFYLGDYFASLVRSPITILALLPLLAGFALGAFVLYQVGSQRSDGSLETRSSQRETRSLENVGRFLRGLGFLTLGLGLMVSETPTFAVFVFVKGSVAMICFAEAGTHILPTVVTRLSQRLQDSISSNRDEGGISSTEQNGSRSLLKRILRLRRSILKFVNSLNFSSTRPVSVLWLSLKYHFQPSVPSGGVKGQAQAILHYLVLSGFFLASSAWVTQEVLRSWFVHTYHDGADLKLIFASLVFWATLYLLRFGLSVIQIAFCSAASKWPVTTGGGVLGLAFLGLVSFDGTFASIVNGSPYWVFSVFVSIVFTMALEQLLMECRLRRREVMALRRRQERLHQIRGAPNRRLAIVFIGSDDLSALSLDTSDRKLTPRLSIERWRILRDRLGSDALQFLANIAGRPGDETLEGWFHLLHNLEDKANVTLWHPRQLCVRGAAPALLARDNLHIEVESEAQRDQVLVVWHIRRWIATMMSTAGQSQDTGINLVEIASRLNNPDVDLARHVVFYIAQNKHDDGSDNRPSQMDYNLSELGQRSKLAKLLMAIAPDCRAYVVNNWTPFGFKAGAMTGTDLVPEEALKLTNLLVLDRNATALDLNALMDDIVTALSDPRVINVIPGRGTTNTRTAIGQGSQMIEEGHRAQIQGAMVAGGVAGESLGTGWGNIQAVHYGLVQRALVTPGTVLMPLTSRQEGRAAVCDRVFGLIGFGPHAVGISEDLWSVTQAAHNAISMGISVRFEQSKTFWHKLRETWSHSEWFTAFPRWSGGYFQTMCDPIMQRINDLGPLSIFAKEVRANGGRFFLSAPLALLFILLMPIAIIWGISPFLGILALLWNLGFVMNQVLTTNGLIAYLEASRFHRIPALLGALAGGALGAILPGMRSFGPGLMVVGFLGGGFGLGMARWLYDRARHVLLFAPQLVIYALAQIIRPSLEFVASGASLKDANGVDVAFRTWVGPNENNRSRSYTTWLNLRTVVWFVGLPSLLLNIWVLQRLDFLNVVLLLPSLLFSIGALIGPFVLAPDPGWSLGRKVWLPRLLGWLGCAVFYTVVVQLLAMLGWWELAGMLLLATCVGGVLCCGLKHSRFVRWLADKWHGLFGSRCERLKLRMAFLSKRLDLHDSQLLERFWSSYQRSFVISLFVFLWLLLVPVPGLLIFQAAGFQFFLTLGSLTLFGIAVLGLAFSGLALAHHAERIELRGSRSRAGLLQRAEDAFHKLQEKEHAQRFQQNDGSSLYAQFTDFQIYLDQRGYEYARQTLNAIEQKL